MVRLKAILDASTIIAFFDELQDAAKLLLLRRLDCELLVPDYVYREEILREPSIGVLTKCIHDGSISSWMIYSTQLAHTKD